MRPAVSFEFFPPRNLEGSFRLWDCVNVLGPLHPAFVSVTYGAGGSTRERTHATVSRIVKETELVPAAHLTCVAASKAEIAEIADQYWEAGVRHIVALRGDPPPADGGRFQNLSTLKSHRISPRSVVLIVWPQAVTSAIRRLPAT